MRTIVRCLDESTVIDGFGNETKFEPPTLLTPGKCYLIENSKIVKELLTQEELMEGSANLNVMAPEFWDYQKYL